MMYCNNAKPTSVNEKVIGLSGFRNNTQFQIILPKKNIIVKSIIQLNTVHNSS